MCQKIFLSGFTLGFITAIPIKYGVSLDQIYYYTLILTTFSNSTTSFQRNSNLFIDPSSFINLFIFLLVLIGIVISIKGIFDTYQELQDESQDELIVYGSYGLGFIVGFMIVIGS